jgi:hypothetical protein
MKRLYGDQSANHNPLLIPYLQQRMQHRIGASDLDPNQAVRISSQNFLPTFTNLFRYQLLPFPFEIRN